MKKKFYRSDVSVRVQRAVSDVLTLFMLVENMEDFHKIYNEVFEFYGLASDPFTGCPCSLKDFHRLKYEYDKQAMIDKYGHCDGLE